MLDDRAIPGRPLQFRARDAGPYRLGAGWKLLASMCVGALALACDGLLGLLTLTGLVAAGYAWARLPARDLWQDARWILLQGAVLVALTVAVRGAGALDAGCRTALQLLLVFLPVALVLRTTATEALLEPLRRWLPERLAFALGTALRFVPVFAREAGELIDVQRLRGARLYARDLARPGAWRDGLRCVAYPMTLRAIEVAGEAADAAEMRGIGATSRVRFEEGERA